MRDPRMLLRGLGKLIAVLVVAGLAGAGIGIGLAELTGGDDPAAPVASVPTAQRTATAAAAQTQSTPTTTPTRTQTAPAKPGGRFLVPRIEVISTRLVPAASASEPARISARVRVTNRQGRALEPEQPALFIGDDKVALDPNAKDEAGPLLESLDAGKSASGVLRFVVPSRVAQRLDASTRVRLSIVTRTIVLKLAAASG